jgi:hypothetical protein
MPHLLELDRPALIDEIEQSPKAQGAAALCLLMLVEERFHDEKFHADPERAHELTSLIVRYADNDVDRSQGLLYHARVLCELQRYAEAQDAIAAATELPREFAADFVHARILHGLGRSAEALRLIPAPDQAWHVHGPREAAEAMVLAAQIHHDRGDLQAMENTLSAAADVAWRMDCLSCAHFENAVGELRLQHGDADKAVTSFVAALTFFALGERPRAAARARSRLAEATAAHGDHAESLRLYRVAQRDLLAQEQLIDAAIASAGILNVLLLTESHSELRSFADTLWPTFAAAEFPHTAMHAWQCVRERVQTHVLTREDIAHVRRYFERLVLRPNARFAWPIVH